MKASRVIRDKVTKIGKGTGLLQFESPECVQEALKMDGEAWRDSKIHVVKFSLNEDGELHVPTP